MTLNKGTIIQLWMIGQQICPSTSEISQSKKKESVNGGWKPEVGSQNLNPQLTSSGSSGRPWHKRACPDHCFEAIAATPETNEINTL